MRADTLDLVAGDVLDACRDAYDLPGAPAIPAALFVAHGSPVIEREHVAVVVAGVRPKIGSDKCSIVAVVDLVVQVARGCWPTVTGQTADSIVVPAPADIDEAARLATRDAAVLWAHVADLATTGALVTSVEGVGCRHVTLGTLVPIPPQGGFVGWRWPITVTPQ